MDALCAVVVYFTDVRYPQCCGDESPDVRQSAFAVVGELAKSCMTSLRQALPQVTTVHVDVVVTVLELYCNRGRGGGFNRV